MLSDLKLTLQNGWKQAISSWDWSDLRWSEKQKKKFILDFINNGEFGERDAIGKAIEAIAVKASLDTIETMDSGDAQLWGDRIIVYPFEITTTVTLELNFKDLLDQTVEDSDPGAAEYLAAWLRKHADRLERKAKRKPKSDD